MFYGVVMSVSVVWNVLKTVKLPKKHLAASVSCLLTSRVHHDVIIQHVLAVLRKFYCHFAKNCGPQGRKFALKKCAPQDRDFLQGLILGPLFRMICLSVYH